MLAAWSLEDHGSCLSALQQTKKTPSSPIEIDFLAAQMLPKLVPSIKVGTNVKIFVKESDGSEWFLKVENLRFDPCEKAS
jgi:hypothetical protein